MVCKVGFNMQEQEFTIKDHDQCSDLIAKSSKLSNVLLQLSVFLLKLSIRELSINELICEKGSAIPQQSSWLIGALISIRLGANEAGRRMGIQLCKMRDIWLLYVINTM